MITTKLKTILTAAGCTSVLYEAKELANIIADQALQSDIIAVIIQPTEVTLEVKANGVHEHYPPVMVEIMKQVPLEDSAENNEVTFVALLEICKAVIGGLIDSGDYKKITSLKVSKILETRYDANVIGWAMPLDLFYLENKNNC